MSEKASRLVQDLCNQSDIYYNNKLWKEAREVLFKALELGDIYAEVIYRLGQICEREEKYEYAIYWYKSIVNMQDENKPIRDEGNEFWTWKPWLQLCVCYYKIGEVEKSYKAHKKVKKLVPQNKFVLENDKFFNNMINSENLEINRVLQLFKRIKPSTVLEISNRSHDFVKLIEEVLNNDVECPMPKIDKISLIQDEVEEKLYNRVYGWETLNYLDQIPRYDIIILRYALCEWDDQEIRDRLSQLLLHCKQSLLIIENKIIGDKSRYRRFHPTYFKAYDFSYFLAEANEGQIQFYNIFSTRPKKLLSHSQQLLEVNSSVQSLKIGYLIPNGGLTGGTKCLLEQIRQLQKVGNKVYVFKHGKKGERVLPYWSDLNEGKDIEKGYIIEEDKEFKKYTEELDIIVVGWMNLLTDVVGIKKPIVLWEQGSCELFGDYGELISRGDSYKLQLEYLYTIPDYILSVSEIIREILYTKYDRESYLLTTAIDTQVYIPLENKEHKKVVLLVGNPFLKFKGFESAIKMLESLWVERQDFRVKWICQGLPQGIKCSFPIEYIVAPIQEDLIRCYQTADIFVSPSLYESFAMPPLEAMSCGIPVVATNCGGIMTYAKDKHNCLIIQQEDEMKFIQYLHILLDSEEERKRIGQNGRKTAIGFGYNHIIKEVERYMRYFVEEYKKKDRNYQM